MNKHIQLDFVVNDSERVSLKWVLVNETYSLFWYKCIYQLINGEAPCSFRFTGLNTESKNMMALSEQLNTIIDLINQNTNYRIEQRADGTFSQEFANAIHHHFEVLYGDAHSPSQLYLDSTPMIRSAITKINHIIHDMEACHRSNSDSNSNRAIVVEFLNRAQFKMNDEFLKHFSLDVDFGDLVLHYGIIGKSWWEVFLDGDQDIFEDAIRPLHFMSGEFDIHFSKFHPDERTKKSFHDFLEDRGVDRSDPKQCLGYLCLAKLDLTNISQVELERLLDGEIKVEKISLGTGKDIELSFDLMKDEMAMKGFFQIQEPLDVSSGKIQLKKCAVQLIPLVTKEEKLVLTGKIIARSWENFEHSLCLMGTSDQNKIEISKESMDIELERSIVLGKGDILELAYDRVENRYVLVGARNS